MPQIIKTSSTTYNIKQIGLDFMVFNEDYRRIRGRAKYKGFNCFSCEKNFVDGEKISLAITDKGNKVLCQSCGGNIKKDLEELTNE
ncbi:hypothetical protein M3685_02280 [Heyndrickxia oleronia]|uniref:hypothetical protein n=1 Tax=Heyndrickxia oleronia TaxID=38875 RepID=UPI0020400748|nr:hypothetical protein [Heyndrickxia oleronia]MCM3452775.1 hypothetical protein [Heyndrickxia oleronia]